MGNRGEIRRVGFEKKISQRNLPHHFNRSHCIVVGNRAGYADEETETYTFARYLGAAGKGMHHPANVPDFFFSQDPQDVRKSFTTMDEYREFTSNSQAELRPERYLLSLSRDSTAIVEADLPYGNGVTTESLQPG